MREFDLLSDPFFADPYPVLAALQDEAPCYFDRRLDAHIVTRYRDVERVLQDARGFSSVRASQFGRGAPDHVLDMLGVFHRQLDQFLVFTDPPIHTRLRTRLGRAFSPGFVTQIREASANVVTEVLGELDAVRTPDLIRDYAHPIPTRILAHLLGVARSDIDRFTRWTFDIFAVASGITDEHVVEAGYRAVEGIRAYVLELLADRRRKPRDDILSALAGEETIDGVPSRLEDDEVVALYMVLFLTGHQSTTNFLGNALHAVMLDPACRVRALAPDGLGEDAIHELVRYDAPFFSLIRRAVADTTIADTPIRRGDFVVCMLCAANRDPRVFPDPHRIDFSRRRPPHLGFGTGIHSCIGATMARIVSWTAIVKLFARYPRAQIDPRRCTWLSSIAIRGLSTCPVELGLPSPASL